MILAFFKFFDSFIHSLIFPRQSHLTFDARRYVGSVRAVNAQLLDAYLLKSLDGLPTPALTADDAVIRPCAYRDGVARKLCVWPKDDPIPSARRDRPDEETVLLGEYSKSDTEAVAFVNGLKTMRVRTDGLAAGLDNGRMKVGRSGPPAALDPLGPRPLTRGNVMHDMDRVVVRVKDLNQGTVDRFAEFSRRSGTPFPLTYGTCEPARTMAESVVCIIVCA